MSSVREYDRAMIIRRAMYFWMLPAAFVLPLWLLIGWAVFNASSMPWALIPVLFVFAPSVFVAQIVLGIMVRVRPSVKTARAVSWQDVVVFAIWHLLTIGVGMYYSPLFAITLVLAVLAAIAVFWSSLTQLWREGRNSYVSRGARTGATPVIVVEETAAFDDAVNGVRTPMEPGSTRVGE